MGQRTADIRHRLRSCAHVARLAAMLVTAWPVAAGGQPSVEAPRAVMSAVDVKLARDRVTLRVDSVPLIEVLRSTAAQAGFHLKLLEEPATAPVTARCTDLLIEDCVRRLARGYSLTFIYTSGPGEEAKLSELWVLAAPASPGQAPPDPVRPTPSTATASRPERSAPPSQVSTSAAGQSTLPWDVIRQSSNPLDRVRAASTLGMVSHPAALPALIASLNDDDARVRQSVIRGLQNRSESEAEIAIAAALQRDADPGVRLVAVAALRGLGTPGAAAALRAAAADQDEAVRKAAQTALAALERDKR